MKLKGFTLLELLAGMTAMSIAIALVFSALHITNKLSSKLQSSLSRNTELSSFHTALHSDIFHSDSCRMSESTGNLLFYSESGIIRYVCNEQFAVRVSAARSDTIRTKMKFIEAPSVANGLFVQINTAEHMFTLPLYNVQKDLTVHRSIEEWIEQCKTNVNGQ